MQQIATAIFINVIVPIIGIIYFLALLKKMKREQTTNPPTKELFLLFFTIGILIVVSLTSLTSNWSALASLGSFYLILVAPIVMLILILKMRDEIHNSRFHTGILLGSIGYFIALPIFLFILYLLS